MIVTILTIQNVNIFHWYIFVSFFFFFIFVLFLIMFRLSHIRVSYDICKLLKSYHYEEGFFETITSFLLASSKNKKKKLNVLVISYCVFAASKHFIFGFIFTSIRSKVWNLLKHFLKSNKKGPSKECQHNFAYNILGKNRVQIFTMCMLVDKRIFLQAIRRKPENFGKKCKNRTFKGGKVVWSSKHCIC